MGARTTGGPTRPHGRIEAPIHVGLIPGGSRLIATGARVFLPHATSLSGQHFATPRAGVRTGSLARLSIDREPGGLVSLQRQLGVQLLGLVDGLGRSILYICIDPQGTLE